MKKYLTLLTLFTIAALSPRWLMAEDIKRSPRDILTHTIGSSTDVALGISSGGVVYNTEGLVNVREVFAFITAPSTSAIISSGTHITVASNTATHWPDGSNSLNQPPYPSPLIFNLTFNAGTSTKTWLATATVSGIDSKGSSRTVRVVVTTTPASTNHAFVKISSISIGVFQSSETEADLDNHFLTLTVGTTYQIGLANDVLSPGDVYAWYENEKLITSATVNAQYDWVQPRNLPNYSVSFSTGQDAWLLGNRYEGLYRVRQSPPTREKPGR